MADRSRLDAARAFLERELAAGPAATSELQVRARSAKVAWRSVERAKGASGGRYDARRASEGGAARYVWAIVAEA